MRKGHLVEGEEEEAEVGEEVASVEVVVPTVEVVEDLVDVEEDLVDVEVAVEDSEEAEVEAVDVDSEVEDDECLAGWDLSFHWLIRPPLRSHKQQRLGPTRVFRLLIDCSLVQLNFYFILYHICIFSAVEFLFYLVY